MAVTKPEEWAKLNDAERHERLVRAELARDNALFMIEEMSGRATERRQKELIREQAAEYRRTHAFAEYVAKNNAGTSVAPVPA